MNRRTAALVVLLLIATAAYAGVMRTASVHVAHATEEATGGTLPVSTWTAIDLLDGEATLLSGDARWYSPIFGTNGAESLHFRAQGSAAGTSVIRCHLYWWFSPGGEASAATGGLINLVPDDAVGGQTPAVKFISSISGVQCAVGCYSSGGDADPVTITDFQVLVKR